MPSLEARVHYGVSASGNARTADAVTCDRLARALGGGVLCFERSAADVVNDFPSLFIRGISTYADSHYNSVWTTYAAAMALAYADELLWHDYTACGEVDAADGRCIK